MKLLTLSLIFSLFISSCSNLPLKSIGSRFPAAINTEEIAHYLAIDKFKYYLNEYSLSQEGKIPDAIINRLKSMRVDEIMNMNLDDELMKDAKNYDEIVYGILKEENLLTGVTKTQLQWNYNFFKNKLNEAFNLAPSRLDIALTIPSTATDINAGIAIVPEVLAPEDMTLDSGHYISNRTTRAIFWEANENNRPIEFHLGDSREFLKELKDKNGELLFEVKPFAKNYNKIYIVQYPGESTYRYAITNIGGKDRLDHLTHQISLSNLSGQQLNSKVIVKGDIKKFHAAKTEEHAMQLRLLPKADRVIIGQKESIDGKFNLFWKIKALKNLYDSDQPAFNSKLSSLTTKERDKFFALLNGNNHEALFKDKKVIEDAFAMFETEFAQNPNLVPGKFKIYNYDNFTVEMCDYVFESNGKTTRWRVVSNVWGDEVIPIAQALKNTGHHNISYMGTAGAFADKGYKVGDLVIPGAIKDSQGSLPMQAQAMQIEGARYGGTVEHVGSPFEEDTAWLARARTESDFVEVETSYLRRIFNGPEDKLELYLLVSDILGSDSETLAHATSGKRKNAQNKLLAKLFERDAAISPVPAKVVTTDAVQKAKNLIFKVLEKKTPAFRYYVFSHLKHNANLTEVEILEFAKKKASFTDAFLIERLVKISEVIHELKKTYPQAGDFDIAFSKSLVEGTWNPKAEKLEILIKAPNAESKKILEKALLNNKLYLDAMSSFATFDVNTVVDNAALVWMKTPDKTDPDFLVKVYAHAGFQSAGLYKNVTYNGNITLDILPTSVAENPLKSFFQGTAAVIAPPAPVHVPNVVPHPPVHVPAGPRNLGETCIDAMRNLMRIF